MTKSCIEWGGLPPQRVGGKPVRLVTRWIFCPVTIQMLRIVFGLGFIALNVDSHDIKGATMETPKRNDNSFIRRYIGGVLRNIPIGTISSGKSHNTSKSGRRDYERAYH